MARSALAVGITALACLAAAAPAAAQSDQAEPDVVRVGALINDIQQLDLQTHSYAVDIYLWCKWDNPEIDLDVDARVQRPAGQHLRLDAGIAR